MKTPVALGSERCFDAQICGWLCALVEERKELCGEGVGVGRWEKGLGPALCSLVSTIYRPNISVSVFSLLSTLSSIISCLIIPKFVLVSS